jgi:hypothetical protein
MHVGGVQPTGMPPSPRGGDETVHYKLAGLAEEVRINMMEGKDNTSILKQMQSLATSSMQKGVSDFIAAVKEGPGTTFDACYNQVVDTAPGFNEIADLVNKQMPLIVDPRFPGALENIQNDVDALNDNLKNLPPTAQKEMQHFIDFANVMKGRDANEASGWTQFLDDMKHIRELAATAVKSLGVANADVIFSSD